MEFLINQFLKPVYPNKLVRNKQDPNMTKNPKTVYVAPTSLLGSINGSQTHTESVRSQNKSLYCHILYPCRLANPCSVCHNALSLWHKLSLSFYFFGGCIYYQIELYCLLVRMLNSSLIIYQSARV